MDEILKKLGLKWEDLDTPGHAGEKEQLRLWLEALQKNQLTTDKIKDSLTSMRYAVEQELVDEPEIIWVLFIFPRVNRKHIFLKARLKNYMLIEALLTSPERAKAMLEQMLSNIKSANV